MFGLGRGNGSRGRVDGFVARWSPDGTRLIFQSAVEASAEGSDLATCGADGSDLVMLTQTSSNELTPIWSPDGSTIAFRWVSRALGERGVPILRSVVGSGTFEGADLMWLGPDRALLATGLRTNDEGAAQVKEALEGIGVQVLSTRLPSGSMHLMGLLRILDRDLAVGWPERLPGDAAAAVEGAGFRLHFLPDEYEARAGFSLNVVTLAPRKILMPAGNPVTRGFYADLGVACVEVEVGELGKAAGSIGCLTGVLERG